MNKSNNLPNARSKKNDPNRNGKSEKYCCSCFNYFKKVYMAIPNTIIILRPMINTTPNAPSFSENDSIMTDQLDMYKIMTPYIPMTMPNIITAK